MAFEDAPGGILSAHQAGMQVIMVPDLVQPTQEIRELTYRVCDSLADVIGILKLSHWDGEKECICPCCFIHVVPWKKVFQKQHIYSLQNSKKGLRYFCKIIYKRGLIWQGEMKKRILQNLKL